MFQTFFFPTVNELYIRFPRGRALNTATPHFYPFQFSGIKYLPPAFVRGCGFGQIHSCKEGAFERNTVVEQGNNVATKYILERVLKSNGRAVIWNRDNVSPLELDRGAVFRFCPSWFLSDGSAVDKWQEGRLMSKFAPPPLYFAAYPIGIKLLQGSAEKETNSWCSAAQIGKSVGITEFPRIEPDQNLRYRTIITKWGVGGWAGVLYRIFLFLKVALAAPFSSLKCLPCLRELRGF